MERFCSRARVIAPPSRLPPQTARRCGRWRRFRAKRHRGIPPAGGLASHMAPGDGLWTMRIIRTSHRKSESSPQTRSSRRRVRRASFTTPARRTSRCAGRRMESGLHFTRTRSNLTMSGCDRRTAPPRCAASACSVAAPKPGGRAGRPTGAGCCSRARAARRSVRCYM